MSYRTFLEKGVILEKPEKYLSKSDFMEYLESVKNLGGKRILGNYRFIVYPLNIFTLNLEKAQELIEKLKKFSVPGAEELESVLQEVKNLQEKYQVYTDLDPSDQNKARVFINASAEEAVLNEMNKDISQGGFKQSFKKYDRSSRGYVVQHIYYYKKSRDPASPIIINRGHLGRLGKLLDGAGIKHNIWEMKYDIDVDESKITVPLRDYQAKAVKSLLEQVKRFGTGSLMAATGSGKTEMGIAVSQALNPDPSRPVVVVVPTKDLVMQWVNRFKQYGEDPAFVTGDSSNFPAGWKVLISTYQTPSRTIEKYSSSENKEDVELPEEEEEDEEEEKEKGDEENKDENVRYWVYNAVKNAKGIIFDEAHHLPAKSVVRIAKANSKAVKIGLSATPWRNDERDMIIYGYAGEISDKITSSDLIEKGFLVPAVVILFNTGVKIEEEKGKYYNAVKKAVLLDPKRIELAKEIAKNIPRPALILTQEKKPAEALYEEMKKDGLSVELITGDMGTEKREEILSNLKEGKTDYVIATSLADEGLDAPILRSIILYYPGKSRTKVFQRIGRALRPAEKKNAAVIVDLVDDVPYFRDHAEKRKEMYETEPKWIVKEASSIEDLVAVLKGMIESFGSDVEKKMEKVRKETEELIKKGWKQINEKLVVMSPRSQPSLKYPLFSKEWNFGPYKVEAYRDLESGDGVWILIKEKNREKKKVTA